MRRPPQMTSSDVKAWKRLIADAERGAAGSIGLGDLATSARVARRCVVPGALSRDNAFVRLQRLAERFVAATSAQRRELAAELAALAGECKGAFVGRETPAPAPAADPPRTRFRPDIDG